MSHAKHTISEAIGAETDREMLNTVLRETFEYFLREVNDETGLVADKNQAGSPASTAATGLGIGAYVVAAERQILTRSHACAKALTVMRFLASSRQGLDSDATGYKGLYYHFLDMKTGRRVWESELSTIDTAVLMAGILTAAAYFTGQDAEEREIRRLAEFLFERVDWQWATDGKAAISHGWKPESGFLPFQWDRCYSEALILYILAAGSQRFPVGPAGYQQWTSSFELKRFYGMDYIYAGPLFIHQLSHCWIDFRGIRDRLNREIGFDYFENSRRATHVHRLYAMENPHGFRSYGELAWGFTASDGPGPDSIEVDGVRRKFYGYVARGAPLGPDDGTISPWAAAASLPFTPEIVVETLRHAIEHFELKGHSGYGFDASFNPTFPGTGKSRHGWISPWVFGLNQGPVILMIDNYQSELVWSLLRQSPEVVRGLRNLGFQGGWLETPAKA
jgi:hypothetical protein